MATRTYTSVGRTFHVVLSGTPHPSGDYASWTVEHVFEQGDEIEIPGMVDGVAASTEDQAFEKACARIDRWIGRQPAA